MMVFLCLLRLLFVTSIFTKGSSELTQPNTYVKTFIDFLNALPNQAYLYEDGILLNNAIVNNQCQIEVSLKARDLQNSESFKLVKCKAFLQENEQQLTVVNNQYECHEDIVKDRTAEEESNIENDVTTEDNFIDVTTKDDKIRLDNEIQSNPRLSSGEQFVAIPRPSIHVQCIGCSSMVDPQAAGVKELAQYALRHLDRHEPDVKHILNTVSSVERQVQVVNGVRYIIILTADYCTPVDGEMQCNESKTCKISVLEKPWLKLVDGSKFRAVLANNCTEEWIYNEGETIDDSDTTNDSNVIKVVHQSETLSKPQDRSLTDERLKEIQDQIITKEGDEAKIIENLNTKLPKIDETEKAHESSLSEVRKKAIDNFLNIIELSEAQFNPLSDKELSKTKYDDDTQITTSTDKRVKRKVLDFVPGGVQYQDPNKEVYKQMAKDSMKQHLGSMGIKNKYKLLKVTSVKTQIVSGKLTEINFIITPYKERTEITCHSKIWEKPWKAEQEINVSCNHKERIKRSVRLGGAVEKDPNDPKYTKYAEDSLDKYVSSTGSTDHWQLYKVSYATEQVVAGSKIYIKFSILNSDNVIIPCDSNIWSRPWLHQQDVDVKCYPEKGTKMTKRSIVMTGGKNVQNPENPKYKKLAQDSLSKYMKDKNLQNLQKSDLDVQVDDVTSQIVNGVLTEIHFKVLANKEISLNCFSKIYSQGHEQDIDVECKDANNHKQKRSALFNPLDRKGAETETSQQSANTVQINKQKSYVKSRATLLAQEALKHLEAKYPHPRKQTIVKVYSFKKENIAGIHYKINVEVGFTNCSALSYEEYCTPVSNLRPNKYCKLNIWLRSTNEALPVYRVFCEQMDNATIEIGRELQAQHLFNEFLMKYNPIYIDNQVEKSIRYNIFKNNINKINELNTHERGTARYGITKVSDLTHEEFTEKYLGLKPSLRSHNQIPRSMASIPDVDLPDKFDWRDQGAVTEVKNQGLCGSCWAFSVTGNIEGQYKIKTGKLVSLSEQELVDCDKMDQGCNGGLPDNAYRAIEAMGGLESEQDYPYEGADDKCEFNSSLARVRISSAVNISSDETEMAKWLVAHGPISIGLNANAMQFYMGGVSHPWKLLCNPKNLDHGVLIVGYGTKDYPLFKKKLPYWTIKNSWGPSWGEQGYYRVYRGDGTCGVNLMASSAII